MKKLIYIDTETTGLDPKKAVIHQLAGIIEIDGTVKEEFDFRIKPYSDDPEINDKALEVSGVTREDIAQYEGSLESFYKFKSLLKEYVDPFNKNDKFIVVGYNCHAFDMQFLREFWRIHNDKYFGSFFHQLPIDVLLLISYLNQNRIKVKSFKLIDMVAYYLDKEFPAHDALEDIKVTRHLYKCIDAILNPPTASGLEPDA